MIEVRSTVAAVGLVAAVALSLTACTGSQDPPSPPPWVAPTSTGPPGPLETIPPPTTAPTRSIKLGCADAGYANKPGGDLTVGGLTLENLAQGSLDEGSDPYPVPLATDVGLVVSPGSTQRFQKSPAYLKAGTGPFTLELIRPVAGQALAWVPSKDWTGGSPPDLRPWMTDRLTLTGCADRDTAYFGGVLVPTPDSCLILRIQQPDGPAQVKRIRLDGKPC